MPSRDQIAQQALGLPQEDRVFLADLLEQSLERDEGFATPEIAAAWATEIQHRLTAYDRGELAAEDSQVVLQRLQTRLASERAARPSSQ